MLNPEEQKEIEKAVIMLVDCVQKSCSNLKPVIFHSLRVGAKLFGMGQRKEVVIAGILHDLLEDTDCLIQQIDSIFGSQVSALVSALTFDKSIRDYKKRWTREIAQIKKLGQEAMFIKVADAMDNLPYYIFLLQDGPKLKEVLWKHRLTVKEFESGIGGSKIFKEYKSQLERVLKKVKINSCMK